VKELGDLELRWRRYFYVTCDMNNKLIYDKIIDLQLYQIKYTESYDVLNLVHRFSNKKLNKTGLVFL
jgi:hypothetical protein